MADDTQGITERVSGTEDGQAGPAGGEGSQPVALEEEMRRSYLDYAMSVIVARALPDARDWEGKPGKLPLLER